MVCHGCAKTHRLTEATDQSDFGTLEGTPCHFCRKTLPCVELAVHGVRFRPNYEKPKRTPNRVEPSKPWPRR